VLALKSSGWRKPSEKDLVVGSQGLRGSDPGVVWRREMSLPHWKPGLPAAKSKIHNSNSGETIWQTCNSWKIQS
jgi:hypothetical protein